MDIPTLVESEPKSPATFLQEGQFRFQSFSEAQIVAEFIASACHTPRLALLGISEIFFNAIEHGNLNLSYEEKSELQKQNKWIEEIERRLSLPENQHKFVQVDFSKKENEIHIKVTDQGPGFDWKPFEEIKQEERMRSHGRGISIAKNLAFSRLEFLGKGNQVLGVIPCK